MNAKTVSAETASAETASAKTASPQATVRTPCAVSALPSVRTTARRPLTGAAVSAARIGVIVSKPREAGAPRAGTLHGRFTADEAESAADAGALAVLEAAAPVAAAAPEAAGAYPGSAAADHEAAALQAAALAARSDGEPAVTGAPVTEAPVAEPPVTEALITEPPVAEASAPSSPLRATLARLNTPAGRAHFGTAVGVAVLVVLLWRLGTGVFLDGLRRIDGGALLVALGIGGATTVFSAWRWALVARGLGIRLPLGPAVADYYRSLFLNAALPGGVLGDVHRAVRHGQSSGDLGRGVRSVVLERAAGQIALAVVGVTVLLTMPSPVRDETRQLAPLVGLAVLGAPAVVLAVRMNRAPSTTSRRGRALRSTLAEAREGLLSRRNGPGVAVSSVVVLAGHIGMFVLAARIVGSDASVPALLPLAVLALLAMGVPLNVGGFGPREGVTAWAFAAAGLGAATGLAVAVVYGVLSFVAALPGALVLVARWYQGLRPRYFVSADVSSEKYAPKDSARLASSAFPFSAELREGRPMTPESV